MHIHSAHSPTSCRRLSSRRRTACVHLVSSRLPKHASLFNAICTGYAVPHVRFGQTRRSMHPMFPPWYCPTANVPTNPFSRRRLLLNIILRIRIRLSRSPLVLLPTTRSGEEDVYHGWTWTCHCLSIGERASSRVAFADKNRRKVVAALIQRRRYPYVLSIEASTSARVGCACVCEL